jgi:hypothetical protein
VADAFERSYRVVASKAFRRIPKLSPLV